MTEREALDVVWRANFEGVQAAKRALRSAVLARSKALTVLTRARNKLADAARWGRPATEAEVVAYDRAVERSEATTSALVEAKAALDEAKARFKAGVTPEQMEAARRAVRRP